MEYLQSVLDDIALWPPLCWYVVTVCIFIIGVTAIVFIVGED